MRSRLTTCLQPCSLPSFESGVPVVVADRLADVVNGSVADGEIGGQLGPCPPTPHAGP